MEIRQAIDALAALAQDTRLRTFRLLVEYGHQGMAAGEIAQDLAIPQNTLSTHLGILQQAGLLTSRRQGRSVIYAVDFDGLRAVLAFLLQDCCRGQAELCAPVLDAVIADCCTTGVQP